MNATTKEWGAGPRDRGGAREELAAPVGQDEAFISYLSALRGATQGIRAKFVAAEFREHANEEQAHAEDLVDLLEDMPKD